MKRILLLSVLVYFSFASMAQITITRSDMPASGDTIRYSSAGNATALKFDTTGANITWNYDSLVPTGQNIDSFRSALSISPIYALYFGLTDYGLSAGASLNFGVISLTNLYNFYKTSNSDLEINGFGAEYTNIPLPSAYTIPDKVYQFPMTYGRIDTTPYDLTISVPGVASIRQMGTRINTVDGWGTIITPYGSYQCIRLSSVTNEIDSIHLTTLGLSLGLPRSSTTYKWLANGVKIPVLEVAGTARAGRFTPTSIKYRDNIRFIPPQFSVRADFRANLTTCTTSDTITITNRNRPNPPGTRFLYTITPNTFTFVSGTNDSSAAPRMIFNAPGLYTVSLHVESPAGGSIPATADTTKVDYITVNPSGISTIDAAIMQIYPNPADDHIACTFTGDGRKQITLTLTDIKGSTIFSTTVDDNAHLSIPSAHLPAGEYLLKATSAGSSAVRKVQVLH